MSNAALSRDSLTPQQSAAGADILPLLGLAEADAGSEQSKQKLKEGIQASRQRLFQAADALQPYEERSTSLFASLASHPGSSTGSLRRLVDVGPSPPVEASSDCPPPVPVNVPNSTPNRWLAIVAK